MSNIPKQEILDAIQRTAKQNGGRPLGQDKFASETGIQPWHWGKYWARFGDAQKDAGLEQNKRQTRYEDEFLIGKMIGFMRRLGKFPSYRDLIVEKNKDPEFLGQRGLFKSYERKLQLAKKIVDWCKGKDGYDDIANLCLPVLDETEGKEIPDEIGASTTIGEVYLFKSGRNYKIGKTSDTVRRGSEIRTQLAEELKMIHAIKTDDPSGIEAYWHKRFEKKRMRGEWFNLNSSDIKAFKRWRRIF